MTRRIAAGDKHIVLFCLTVCFLLVLGSSQGSCKEIVAGLSFYFVWSDLISTLEPQPVLEALEALELCLVKAHWGIALWSFSCIMLFLKLDPISQLENWNDVWNGVFKLDLSRSCVDYFCMKSFWRKGCDKLREGKKDLFAARLSVYWYLSTSLKYFATFPQAYLQKS